MPHLPFPHESSSLSTCEMLTPSPSPPPYSRQSSASPLSIHTSPTSELALEPSQSPIQKKSPIKRKSKSRRGRNRPIHEITRLKQQIPVLESEIRGLWDRANDTQRQAFVVMAENEQLKIKVQRSKDHAKLLESRLQLYYRQKQSLETSTLPSLGAVGRNLSYEAERDTRILQMLSKSVDENYSNLERVYQAAEMMERETEVEDAKVLETVEGSSVLQVRTVRLQPFEQKTVLRAMWKALEEQTTLRDQECIDIGLEMNKASRVIVLKREILLRGSDAWEGDMPCVSCTIRVVLKKFLERGREIHVWDAFGNWPQAVSTREYGWAIIKPTNVMAADVTVIKNCMFVTSTMIFGEKSAETRSAAQHLVAQLYKQIIDDRHRVIENTLLDQTRAIKKNIQ